MTKLKKNVSVFESDVIGNEGYRYTTGAPYSSIVANRRMTEATLRWMGKDCNSVLDAGSGDGTYSHEIKLARPRLDIVGFDPATSAVEIARRRYPDIEFLVGDIFRQETFPERKFDLLIFRGVLHHLSDPHAAIRNAGKLADKLLIIEPNGNNPVLKVIEKVSRYHREHEEQSFSSARLKRWCRESGYVVSSVEFIGFIPMFFPTLPAKLIYFLQPLLERIPLLGRFLSGQVVIVCQKPDSNSNAVSPISAQ